MTTFNRAIIPAKRQMAPILRFFTFSFSFSTMLSAGTSSTNTSASREILQQ